MFQPIIPIGGIAGWEFLKRTQGRQEDSFSRTPRIRHVTTEFAANFDKVHTADALVRNRQFLSIVLGAFGLQEDIDNRAFIRKVITDGVVERDALANRLADKRYLALARELSHLAQGGTGVAPERLAGSLIERYKATEFEIAVGTSEEAFRFSLAYARKIPEIVEGLRTDLAGWFQILGDPPTRRVLETALGFPSEFGALDIDEQVKRLKDVALKRFGVSNVRELGAPDMIETVTRRFLLMGQLRDSQTAISGAAVALSLLANSTRKL